MILGILWSLFWASCIILILIAIILILAIVVLDLILRYNRRKRQLPLQPAQQSQNFSGDLQQNDPFPISMAIFQHYMTESSALSSKIMNEAHNHFLYGRDRPEHLRPKINGISVQNSMRQTWLHDYGQSYEKSLGELLLRLDNPSYGESQDENVSHLLTGQDLRFLRKIQLLGSMIPEHRIKALDNCTLEENIKDPILLSSLQRLTEFMVQEYVLQYYIHIKADDNPAIANHVRKSLEHTFVKFEEAISKIPPTEFLFQNLLQDTLTPVFKFVDHEIIKWRHKNPEKTNFIKKNKSSTGQQFSLEQFRELFDQIQDPSNEYLSKNNFLHPAARIKSTEPSMQDTVLNKPEGLSLANQLDPEQEYLFKWLVIILSRTMREEDYNHSIFRTAIFDVLAEKIVTPTLSILEPFSMRQLIHPFLSTLTVIAEPPLSVDADELLATGGLNPLKNTAPGLNNNDHDLGQKQTLYPPQDINWTEVNKQLKATDQQFKERIPFDTTVTQATLAFLKDHKVLRSRRAQWKHDNENEVDFMKKQRIQLIQGVKSHFHKLTRNKRTQQQERRRDLFHQIVTQEKKKVENVQRYNILRVTFFNAVQQHRFEHESYGKKIEFLLRNFGELETQCHSLIQTCQDLQEDKKNLKEEKKILNSLVHELRADPGDAGFEDNDGLGNNDLNKSLETLMILHDKVSNVNSLHTSTIVPIYSTSDSRITSSSNSTHSDRSNFSTSSKSQLQALALSKTSTASALTTPSTTPSSHNANLSHNNLSFTGVQVPHTDIPSNIASLTLHTPINQTAEPFFSSQLVPSVLSSQVSHLSQASNELIPLNLQSHTPTPSLQHNTPTNSMSFSVPNKSFINNSMTFHADMTIPSLPDSHSLAQSAIPFASNPQPSSRTIAPHVQYSFTVSDSPLASPSSESKTLTTTPSSESKTLTTTPSSESKTLTTINPSSQSGPLQPQNSQQPIRTSSIVDLNIVKHSLHDIDHLLEKEPDDFILTPTLVKIDQHNATILSKQHLYPRTMSPHDWQLIINILTENVDYAVVHVTSAVPLYDNHKAYSGFDICITVGKFRWAIRRRFSNLLTLQSYLKSAFGRDYDLTLPNRRLMNFFDGHRAALERCQDTEQYLNDLVKRTHFLSHPVARWYFQPILDYNCPSKFQYRFDFSGIKCIAGLQGTAAYPPSFHTQIHPFNTNAGNTSTTFGRPGLSNGLKRFDTHHHDANSNLDSFFIDDQDFLSNSLGHTQPNDNNLNEHSISRLEPLPPWFHDGDHPDSSHFSSHAHNSPNQTPLSLPAPAIYSETFETSTILPQTGLLSRVPSTYLHSNESSSHHNHQSDLIQEENDGYDTISDLTALQQALNQRTGAYNFSNDPSNINLYSSMAYGFPLPPTQTLDASFSYPNESRQRSSSLIITPETLQIADLVPDRGDDDNLKGFFIEDTSTPNPTFASSQLTQPGIRRHSVIQTGTASQTGGTHLDPKTNSSQYRKKLMQFGVYEYDDMIFVPASNGKYKAFISINTSHLKMAIQEQLLYEETKAYEDARLYAAKRGKKLQDQLPNTNQLLSDQLLRVNNMIHVENEPPSSLSEFLDDDKRDTFPSTGTTLNNIRAVDLTTDKTLHSTTLTQSASFFKKGKGNNAKIDRIIGNPKDIAGFPMTSFVPSSHVLNNPESISLITSGDKTFELPNTLEKQKLTKYMASNYASILCKNLSKVYPFFALKNPTFAPIHNIVDVHITDQIRLLLLYYNLSGSLNKRLQKSVDDYVDKIIDKEESIEFEKVLKEQRELADAELVELFIKTGRIPNEQLLSMKKEVEKKELASKHDVTMTLYGDLEDQIDFDDLSSLPLIPTQTVPLSDQQHDLRQQVRDVVVDGVNSALIQHSNLTTGFSGFAATSTSQVPNISLKPTLDPAIDHKLEEVYEQQNAMSSDKDISTVTQPPLPPIVSAPSFLFTSTAINSRTPNPLMQSMMSPLAQPQHNSNPTSNTDSETTLVDLPPLPTHYEQLIHYLVDIVPKQIPFPSYSSIHDAAQQFLKYITPNYASLNTSETLLHFVDQLFEFHESSFMRRRLVWMIKILFQFTGTRSLDSSIKDLFSTKAFAGHIDWLLQFLCGFSTQDPPDYQPPTPTIFIESFKQFISHYAGSAFGAVPCEAAALKLALVFQCPVLVHHVLYKVLDQMLVIMYPDIVDEIKYLHANNPTTVLDPKYGDSINPKLKGDHHGSRLFNPLHTQKNTNQFVSMTNGQYVHALKHNRMSLKEHEVRIGSATAPFSALTQPHIKSGADSEHLLPTPDPLPLSSMTFSTHSNRTPIFSSNTPAQTPTAAPIHFATLSATSVGATPNIAPMIDSHQGDRSVFREFADLVLQPLGYERVQGPSISATSSTTAHSNANTPTPDPTSKPKRD